MSLSEESITFTVGLIMKDLDSYIEGRDALLNKEIYNDLDTWLEYFEDASDQEKSTVLDEVHERLGDMSVWVYDHEEQQDILNKISIYFISNYGSEGHIKFFCKLIIDYLKKELKNEFF
ncbi:hypothetical protein [Paenibacillus sp. FSL H3-0333]|uniref:hypothetical protein n=1 Tax=Paenibacillus sp. FSL H3-0333 TaxID=2921373 RepID=UPI0030F99D09